MFHTGTYAELHRPQFHYTPRSNWTNDPNGLVYHKGEYHLFYQLNAQGLRWGPNTWGHAVSSDLVHWHQLGHAIEPNEYGWIWSGSAVVDPHNTAGLRAGEEDVLIAIYSTGGVGKHGFPDTPVVQNVAYSNDRGRTWEQYHGNPVLSHVRAENRDPKVIWHEASRQWVMALYLDEDDFALYGSPDLKSWHHLSDVKLPGTSECPDFFPLRLLDDPMEERWVFWGGGGVYRIGSFDGKSFAPETESLKCELGTNGYAAQTWSDIPKTDGRRIQISWMAGGKYPSMPFNQQMSFPVSLSLRSFREGIRLCRTPVAEIALLYDRPHVWTDQTMAAGDRIVPPTQHDLFQISADVTVHESAEFGFILRGIDLRYETGAQQFHYQGHTIPAPMTDGRIHLEILLDRTSMELFCEHGKVSASFCFLPEAWDSQIEIYSKGGKITFSTLCVRELRSAWER